MCSALTCCCWKLAMLVNVTVRPTLIGCMGFVWVHADSLLRCVASPFHSFVTTTLIGATYPQAVRTLTTFRGPDKIPPRCLA